MNISASAGAVTQHSQNISIAKKAQNLQKAEGQAAISLIEGAKKVQQHAQAIGSHGSRMRVNVVA